MCDCENAPNKKLTCLTKYYFKIHIKICQWCVCDVRLILKLSSAVILSLGYTHANFTFTGGDTSKGLASPFGLTVSYLHTLGGS